MNLQSMLCRRRAVRKEGACERKGEIENAGGSREKIEDEESRNARQRYSEGAKTIVERAGFVCL